MSSVSPISSNPGANQSGSVPNFQQIQSDFQSLASSLQSGNLASAQQAFAALQTDAPGLFQSQGSSSSNSATSALTNLGTALQSGNLTSAQKAFSSLQQAVHGHHGHHQHGGGGNSIDSSTSPGIGVTSSGTSSLDGGFSAIA